MLTKVQLQYAFTVESREIFDEWDSFLECQVLRAKASRKRLSCLHNLKVTHKCTRPKAAGSALINPAEHRRAGRGRLQTMSAGSAFTAASLSVQPIASTPYTVGYFDVNMGALEIAPLQRAPRGFRALCAPPRRASALLRRRCRRLFFALLPPPVGSTQARPRSNASRARGAGPPCGVSRRPKARARARTRTHARTHARMHTHPHPHAPTHPPTHPPNHTHTCTHARMHARTCTASSIQ